MASQLFCLALLAVSAFGYDLTYRQQYLPLQNYGLFNQQASSVQGQIPYRNYLLQKQNYLPYLNQQVRYSPVQAQQYIPQGVPSVFEGQVNSPVSQLPLSLARSILGLNDVERQIQLNQYNTLPIQTRDVNQFVNFPVQDNVLDVNQRVNLPVQEHFLPYQLRDVNQRFNLPTQGFVSELSQRLPLVQTNFDDTLRYNNVLAPRYQSLYQYQPVSQIYPARQNFLSLLRPTQQFREQFLQQQLPTYLVNDDNIERNFLNVERNLVY